MPGERGPSRTRQRAAVDSPFGHSRPEGGGSRASHLRDSATAAKQWHTLSQPAAPGWAPIPQARQAPPAGARARVRPGLRPIPAESQENSRRDQPRGGKTRPVRVQVVSLAPRSHSRMRRSHSRREGRIGRRHRLPAPRIPASHLAHRRRPIPRTIRTIRTIRTPRRGALRPQIVAPESHSLHRLPAEDRSARPARPRERTPGGHWRHQ